MEAPSPPGDISPRPTFFKYFSATPLPTSLCEPLEHSSYLIAVKFSPDGKHLLTTTAGPKGQAYLWDADRQAGRAHLGATVTLRILRSVRMELALQPEITGTSGFGGVRTDSCTGIFVPARTC